MSVISEPVTEIAPEVWSVLHRSQSEERAAVLHYRARGYQEAAVRIIDPAAYIDPAFGVFLGGPEHEIAARRYRGA